MSSDEQKQILKMVETGKISADEAMKLIKALETDADEVEIEAAQLEAGPGSQEDRSPEFARPGAAGWAGGEGRPSSGSGRSSSKSSGQEFEEVKARARRYAAIPLGVGVLVTVLASYWLFTLVQASNYGFWFVCAWFPLFLGILLVALSTGGMNSRWLYVNVDQEPGERPQHITLGFPIPLGLLGWLLQNFGHFVPGMDRQQVEDILTLLGTADAQEPLIVNVDEGERGERVQVYIG